MTRFDLTEKEANTLADILESYVADVKTERIATENREWRSELKERESIASDLLGRLEPGKR